jgi:predicted RNA methylase
VSSTNRGAERDPLDFYRTPAEAVRAILPYLGRPRTIVDLGCGDGAIGEVLVQQLGDTTTVIGVEIDPSRAASAEACGPYDRVDVRDVLLWKPAAIDRTFDLAILNPPFRHAEAFVECALSLVRHGGTVAALVRLGWLAGQKRAAFHRAHPCDVHVFSRRPSFTGGGTDSSEYAWLVYGLGRGGRWSLLESEKPRRSA